MHNADSHDLLFDAQPASKQQTTTRWPPPLSFIDRYDVIWYGTSLWLARVSCPVSPPNFLSPSLLIGRAWEVLDLVLALLSNNSNINVLLTLFSS